MSEIDYWAAATAIKRVSVELKGIVKPLRRLGNVKVAAERREARLSVAAGLSCVVADVAKLTVEIIGDHEDDPELTKVRDQLCAGAQAILGTGK